MPVQNKITRFLSIFTRFDINFLENALTAGSVIEMNYN